jgi:hypothetical protein
MAGTDAVTSRPLSRSDRQLCLLWAVVSGAIVLLVPLFDLWTRALPACLLRSVTGIACPSCGSTRALAALANGDPISALAWNPLVTVGIIAFVVGGLMAPAWGRFVGRMPELRGVLWVRVGLAAALALNWIYLWYRGV